MDTPTVELLPPVNPDVAQKTLSEVDNLINWQATASEKFERAGIRLSRFVADVSQNAYWTIRNYKSEREYIINTFKGSRAQYYNLRRAGIELREYPIKVLEEIGISKCIDLVRIKKKDGTIDPNWFILAKTSTRDYFRKRVRSYVGKCITAGDLEEDEIVHFRVWKDAKQIHERAFEIGKLLAGGNDSKSYVLNDIILPEFLSTFNEQGASLVGENNFHLMMIRRHIKHLNIKNDPSVLERLIGEMRAGIADKKEAP